MSASKSALDKLNVQHHYLADMRTVLKTTPFPKGDGNFAILMLNDTEQLMLGNYTDF